MGFVYLGALVVGLGILLIQVITGAQGHGDVAHGFDAHAGGGDAGHAGGGHAGGQPGGDAAGRQELRDLSDDAGIVGMFLTTRFWIFASLAFGLSGTLIHFFALAGPIVTALIASAAGVGAGLFATLAFRVVARGAVSSTSGASEAVGQIGRVLVACSKGQLGQIRVELRGQSVDFMATTDEEALARGEHVLVEEMRGAVAHVSKRPSELA